MKSHSPLVFFLAVFTATFAFSGERVLFDWRNYPWLPIGHHGAEVGDYAKTRELDVRFKGGRSQAEVCVFRGDNPAEMSGQWTGEDAVLNVDFRSAPSELPDRMSLEITALDRSVRPVAKRTFLTPWVARNAAVRCAAGSRLSFRLEEKDVPAGYVAEYLRIRGSSDGHAVITSISVSGSAVRPETTPDDRKTPRSEEHLWLRVKGRDIVTSPLAEGGERPFVPAGVGYGKDVILHGYDELVGEYVKSMGLNTIRLAFYNQYFNSRRAEPLEFRDVVRFVDPVIAAAKRHDLYVILDDHAYFKNEIDEANARGEQKSAGWTKSRFENWVACWGRVAEHYKDEPRILGYELCNEPVCEPAVARKWYRKAIKEIRAHDKRHIVIVGTHNWSHSRALMPTWDGYADKVDYPYGNVVFSFHDYPQDEDPWKVAENLAAFQGRYAVPVMCTEFGAGDAPERVHREYQAGMLGLFASRGVGWMLWTLEDRPDKAEGFPTRFKKEGASVTQIDPAKPRYWIPIPEIWAPIARVVASPMPKAK